MRIGNNLAVAKAGPVTTELAGDEVSEIIGANKRFVSNFVSQLCEGRPEIDLLLPG
jgi:hypothetical protein